MKYIIELEDNPCMYENGLKFYQCKQLSWWGVSENIRNNLEPYYESDGCKDCKFELTEEWEEPCRRCKNSYKNMWRAKE